MTKYGPHNPHPLSQMKTELVWEGKYDEFGNQRVVDYSGFLFPLQRIETVDEPRSRAQAQGSLFDEKIAHRDDSRNRLIWGDNKLVMASLLEEFKGSIDLIYIDPPFDVGADFSLTVPIGESNDTAEKEQSILEMVAYRDMWGRNMNSYLQMLYERLVLMRELLSDTGNILVHCDWRVNSYVRGLLDEIFGADSFVNEVVWKRAQTVKGNVGQGTKSWGANLDSIYLYRKSSRSTFNDLFLPYADEYIEKFYKYYESDGRRYRLISMIGPGGASKGNPRYEVMGVTKYWRYSEERMKRMITDGDLSPIFPPFLRRVFVPDCGLMRP